MDTRVWNCDQVLSQLIILYDERLTQVDFVAQRQGEKLYVQVTQEIQSEKTERREYDRLLEIKDNYPKYVLRTDEFAGGNYEGIKSMHVADFLLSREYWCDWNSKSLPLYWFDYW